MATEPRNKYKRRKQLSDKKAVSVARSHGLKNYPGFSKIGAAARLIEVNHNKVR